jgi:hypothetical protein
MKKYVIIFSILTMAFGLFGTVTTQDNTKIAGPYEPNSTSTPDGPWEPNGTV